MKLYPNINHRSNVRFIDKLILNIKFLYFPFKAPPPLISLINRIKISTERSDTSHNLNENKFKKNSRIIIKRIFWDGGDSNTNRQSDTEIKRQTDRQTRWNQYISPACI